MITAIILFLIAALLGLHILTHILRNKITPKTSVYLHGLFAVIGFIIVLVTAFRDPALSTGAILFTITAIGGIILFVIDNVRKTQPPKWLAVIHPILAVISLIVVIIYTINR